jgi:hypothetical protein
MPPNGPCRDVTVTLEVGRLSSSSSDTLRIGCLGCRSFLELHVPDTQTPERMLGVCRQCGDWFIVELFPPPSGAMIVRLPGRDDLLDIARGSWPDAAPEDQLPPNLPSTRPGRGGNGATQDSDGR